ncbi:MAG TPA: hypothetical protein VFT19_07445 [Solirubrobacterales bacterium]|nr:hypothetical protein [Solirubrobacterales bacterium]
MTAEVEEFWAAMPPKALHPRRVPILEAFRCIGEPLSPVMVVDVLEGEVTMWEAAAHLDALVRLGVLRRRGRDPQAPSLREERFDLFYSLVLGD